MENYAAPDNVKALRGSDELDTVVVVYTDGGFGPVYISNMICWLLVSVQDTHMIINKQCLGLKKLKYYTKYCIQMHLPKLLGIKRDS